MSIFDIAFGIALGILLVVAVPAIVVSVLWIAFSIPCGIVEFIAGKIDDYKKNKKAKKDKVYEIHK